MKNRCCYENRKAIVLTLEFECVIYKANSFGHNESFVCSDYIELKQR